MYHEETTTLSQPKSRLTKHLHLLIAIKHLLIVVDMHGKIIQAVPYDPQFSGPAYTGATQTLGPGFAPFKPYLRPSYFFLRVKEPLSYYYGV